MVVDAPDPASAYLTVRAVGEDGGVLAWDVLLVVEAVGHPALDLPAAQASLVHHRVERMPAVVAPRLGAQGSDEAPGVGCHQPQIGRASCREGVEISVVAASL